MMQRFRRGLRLLAGVLVVCFGVCLGWWLLPRPPAPLEDVSYSRRVFDRNGTLLRLTLSKDDKYRIQTRLAEISPDLIDATLFLEDRHFRRHPGVNPVAAMRAGWQIVLGRSGRGGASTLSMQLARVRYGLRTRTLGGKLNQMFRALQLERHYSKEQILEAYLNLAPYGRNIEGVGAASLLYFGKAPNRLTRHEAIALSVIPQSPTRRTPRVRVENVALTTAAARLTERLHAAGKVSRSDTPFRPIALPRADAVAPHFTRGVLKRQPAGRGDLTTSLEAPLQKLLERRVAGYVASNRTKGIHNAAAMLVDTRSMEVLAQVGSADFRNVAIAGQVDGTQSRRSPGSALKPFVYGLAIDQGLIHPFSLLTDAPRAYGHYNPENFDREFVGPIRASEALARSRNIPAVTLTAQLQRPSFYDLLKQGGVALPHGPRFYGLALPLGGGEVTMEELVRLYASLANGGRVRPLQRLASAAPETDGVRLFSPEAAFLTLGMLGESARPGRNEPTGKESIFWKTGTSHGYRDAWSIAVFDHHVLAVWIGNFDGRSNPAFVGRSCAAPLLFSMVDSLRDRTGASPRPLSPPPGANLKQVTLCAVAGQLPNQHCAHRTEGWFIPGISPIRTCDIHREVLLDGETGLRVAVDDGTRTLRREVFEFWPDELQRLFEKAGLPRRSPPPFLPNAAAGLNATALSQRAEVPRIVSPRGDRILESAPAIPAGVPLSAHAADGVARLYWFADQAFLGSASPRETIFWKPTPGKYRLTALDDQGRSATRTITVASAGLD